MDVEGCRVYLWSGDGPAPRIRRRGRCDRAGRIVGKRKVTQLSENADSDFGEPRPRTSTWRVRVQENRWVTENWWRGCSGCDGRRRTVFCRKRTRPSRTLIATQWFRHGNSRAIQRGLKGKDMRMEAVLLVALTALPVLSQEPVVAKVTIWSDTVKRGEMLRQVRGLGEIPNRQSVTLRIAETPVKAIQPGHKAPMV